MKKKQKRGVRKRSLTRHWFEKEISWEDLQDNTVSDLTCKQRPENVAPGGEW
ncbi:MAG: hypothetical protein JKY95_19120 [Planctomycetaceae bacterium]|nr:hypothetical protein [Planctomycetaceae bacterium]MBL4886623.1 hypothetical protein [Planctomycetaceae bacterium]